MEKDEEKTKQEISCEEKLQQCEKEKQEYLDGWKRQKADFINYQQKELERMSEIMLAVKKELLLKLLAIFDTLLLAKGHLKEQPASETEQGILQIVSQIEKFLKDENVEEIETENQQFDPSLHEAIGEIETDGEEGQIISTVQKGYLLNGQLLRPAKVKVIK